jgi:G3E family GTPase
MSCAPLQLLETSGVADAEPLAASLAAAGFRLTGVAALVDAEAGQEVLQQEVAVAQVRCSHVCSRCSVACWVPGL